MEMNIPRYKYFRIFKPTTSIEDEYPKKQQWEDVGVKKSLNCLELSGK